MFQDLRPGVCGASGAFLGLSRFCITPSIPTSAAITSTGSLGLLG